MHDGADWPLWEGRSFAPLGQVGAREAGRDRRPIFLHGMWRSGSTWLWSRFRAEPGTRCFYEPLHHGLAKLTPARIARDTPGQIAANRHPALTKPYFAEYAPLIERRGVRGYHPRLAYDRFALRPGEAHPALARYIAGLIEHAADEGRRAVLGFNRTGLRIAWLKDRFEATHIHIERDPMSIWASYEAEAAKGNYAFFDMWLWVLERNAADPLFAPLVERLGLAVPRLALASPKARRRMAILAMRPVERYLLVHALWRACSAHAAAVADLVIDTRRAGSRPYRRALSEDLAAVTGLRIDLEGLRDPAPRTAPLSPSVRASVEREAAALAPFGALPSPQRPSAMRPTSFWGAPLLQGAGV